jgi:hypothetical protein
MTALRTFDTAVAALATVALSAATAQADLGPKPRPDCVKTPLPVSDLFEKFTDVDAEYGRYYWKCPEKIPTLTKARAWKEARDQAVHVAYSLISDGAYGYGVASCKRLSRIRFSCRTYFDAEGHIRCKQTRRVWNTADGVESAYVRDSTSCKRSAFADY